MQDMEFTVERGKLWMLQTRNGKRTARAALRIAVEMANEGVITREEAITRVEPSALDQLLHPTIDPKAKRDPIATGLPASPGRGERRDRVLRRRSRGAEPGRPQDDPGAHRDFAGRHSRHAARPRASSPPAAA